MGIRTQRVSRVALVLLITLLAVVSANSQTTSELRARYGEPQTSEIIKGGVTIERFLVRPSILMTVRYTNDGRLCEASLAPVSGSIPTKPTLEHPPTRDYMSTAEVISVINELVPPETRGESLASGSMNGGDPELKLHHPGCAGAYWINYKDVSIWTTSWCWGGTFTAVIHWGKQNAAIPY